jgi:uncharacterized protein (TIGR02646 family)
MRFVDISLLELPNGWKERATQALNELREEIQVAEATANASGADPAVARKLAISAGLNVPARTQIWRDLAPNLKKLKKGQCWYSESRNATADNNVDHFRPKKGVAEDPTHEGYWWLAFVWRNFRYSSQWCNQRRVDRNGGTSGGKSEHFPLCNGSIRARQEADDIDLESPELLDPIDPEDWKLLTFRQDGHPTPASPPGMIDHKRAATSIEVYHLHCNELVNERRVLAGRIERLVQELEKLRPNIQNPSERTLYRDRQIELLRAIDHDSEYSAAARAYARAEIYTLKLGQQIKREWLQEILS